MIDRTASDDSGIPHIAEFAVAGPSLAVRVAQFNPSEIAFVGEPHVHAQNGIAERLCDVPGQGEVRGRSALCAELKVGGRFFLVFP